MRPAVPVLLDDILSTGSGSRLACVLEGGITLRLGENATLHIDALILRGPAARVSLRSFGGALLFDRPASSTTSAAAADLQPATTLQLPWARIGVRGTRFFAGPLDGVNAVFVAEGRVVVEPGGGVAPAALGPGQQLTHTTRLFAGAKEVDVLDAYEGGLPSASYLGVLADAADAAGAPEDYVGALRRRACRSTGL